MWAYRQYNMDDIYGGESEDMTRAHRISQIYLTYFFKTILLKYF